MSLGQAVQGALDAASEGVAIADVGGAHAEVDLEEVDRLAARVRGVRVRRAGDFDLTNEASDLAGRVRSLGEDLVPVEVSPVLGGAVLRTKPEHLRNHEFYELELHGNRDLELRRMRAEPGRDRQAVDFTLTRDQLGRLVDELDGSR